MHCAAALEKLMCVACVCVCVCVCVRESVCQTGEEDCVPSCAAGWTQTEAKLKSETMTKAMMMKVSSKPVNGRSIYTTAQHKISNYII